MPLTRYLRELAGAADRRPELVVALSAVTVAARALVRQFLPYDAVLTPTVAMLPRPVGYFTGPGPGSRLRAADPVHPVDPVDEPDRASLRSRSRCTGRTADCRSACSSSGALATSPR